MENRLSPLHSSNQVITGDRWSDGQLHHKLISLVGDLVHHGIDLNFAKKEMEAMYICEILRAHNGNIGSSAKALGMHRNTLSRRLKELQIQPGSFGSRPGQ